MHNPIPQGQIPNPIQTAQPSLNYGTAPVLNAPPVQTANPNYAGVNIQIFNPMVGSPNGYIYPQQTTSAYGPGVNGGCYPSNYYTGQYGPSQPTVYAGPNGMNNSSPVGQGNNTIPNLQTTAQGQSWNDGTTMQNPQMAQSGMSPEQKSVNSDGQNSDTSNAQNTSSLDTSKTSNSEQTNSDKNSAGVNSADGQVDSSKNNQKTDGNSSDDKTGSKTEKRKVVELTDDYIKTLENYLNSQDVEVRQMGAKEVVNRLMEDPSRNDDPALTALVNKMLQDPSATIRAIALSLVESRTILGDDYTVKVLKNMQNSKEGYGQDAVQATNALLKMAGKTVEKEIPVEDNKSKDKK